MRIHLSVTAFALQLLCASALLAAAVGMLRAEPVNATAKTVRGEAFYLTPSGNKHQLVSGDVIPANSAVQTEANGMVGLQLVPGATTVLSPNTQMMVTSLDFSKDKAGTKQRKITLKLIKGALFSSLVKKSGHSDFKIVTPAGVAAARGTDFFVQVSAAGVTVVQTASGTVELTVTNAAGVTTVISVGTNARYDTSAKTISGLSDADLEKIVQTIEQAGFTTSTTIVDSQGQIINTTTIKSTTGSGAAPEAGKGAGTINGGGAGVGNGAGAGSGVPEVPPPHPPHPPHPPPESH